MSRLFVNQKARMRRTGNRFHSAWRFSFGKRSDVTSETEALSSQKFSRSPSRRFSPPCKVVPRARTRNSKSAGFTNGRLHERSGPLYDVPYQRRSHVAVDSSAAREVSDGWHRRLRLACGSSLVSGITIDRRHPAVDAGSSRHLEGSPRSAGDSHPRLRSPRSPSRRSPSAA